MSGAVAQPSRLGRLGGGSAFTSMSCRWKLCACVVDDWTSPSLPPLCFVAKDREMESYHAVLHTGHHSQECMGRIKRSSTICYQTDCRPIDHCLVAIDKQHELFIRKIYHLVYFLSEHPVVSVGYPEYYILQYTTKSFRNTRRCCAVLCCASLRYAFQDLTLFSLFCFTRLSPAEEIPYHCFSPCMNFQELSHHL